MKRLIFAILIGAFLLGCGGVKGTYPINYRVQCFDDGVIIFDQKLIRVSYNEYYTLQDGVPYERVHFPASVDCFYYELVTN